MLFSLQILEVNSDCLCFNFNSVEVKFALEDIAAPCLGKVRPLADSILLRVNPIMSQLSLSEELCKVFSSHKVTESFQALANEFGPDPHVRE